jgi:iron only hydrogenase large subunit-like protein
LFAGEIEVLGWSAVTLSDCLVCSGCTTSAEEVRDLPTFRDTIEHSVPAACSLLLRPSRRATRVG